LHKVSEVIGILRKWAFLSAVAAVAVIGCGGSNGGSNPTGGTDGTPGTNVTVNLNRNFGRVEFAYISGAGTTAPGDLTAISGNAELEDQFGTVRQQLGNQVFSPLAQYTFQFGAINVPFTGPSVPPDLDTRLFESFRVSFVGFDEEGNSQRLAFVNPIDVSARIRTFPGRRSGVPIYLDSDMFETQSVDGVTSVLIKPESFLARNNEETGGLRSILSDFVAFDLTGMPEADRPQLSNGQPAGRFLLSGDNYAITDANPQQGGIELLTSEVSEPIPGTYVAEKTIGSTNTPGTYQLLQPDPTDLTGIAKIVAFRGEWKDQARAFSGMGNFEVILFPSSKDDEMLEAVAVVRSGNVVSNLYFGFANLDSGELTLNPIKNLVAGTTDGEITGSVSNFRTRNGGGTVLPSAVRTGTFNLTGGTLPAGFSGSGTFVVYRV